MYYDTGRYFNDMQGFSNNCSDDCRTLPCAQSDYRIGNIRFTAATQIHEQTTFVPKTVCCVILIFRFMDYEFMIGFTEKIFIYISNLA